MQSALFHDILKEYWGYDSFRPLQEEIIQSVWERKDTLGLMPTGGGKSLTFQVPTMAMEGLCLVVTPLIALMKDQVDNLKERGIKAAAVYSGMSYDEITATLDNCIYGDYKFLYVSPERLSSDIFIAKMQAMNISLLVVDESHCISQWGYDFRPSYLKIAEIREQLPDVPVLALTATATNDVAKDIQDKLHFEEPHVLRKSFWRDNLAYIVRVADNKEAELEHIVSSVAGTAIVYVRSRKETREVANALQRANISADFFHAGLRHDEKTKKQNAWKQDQCRVMVATNAFGMGIDKPDVRLVIHLDLPNSIEEYYQEAGRAGRDGKRAYAVILYTKRDSAKLKKRVSDSFPKRDFIIRVYDALCNYYQVALGSGLNNMFDFNLHDFCTPFGLPFLPTHHALKILELAGYIEYTEEIESRSRIRFLVLRDDLYSSRLSKDYDELIHAILRNYTGVFSDNVYIDESLLANRLQKSREQVYEMLIQLAKLGYISYIPQKKTPFIVFTSSREELNYITIPKTVYQERKKRFEKRINAMIEYVEQNHVCRSRILLSYFDEKKSENCHMCDVCLQKNETGLTNARFREIWTAIELYLQKKSSVRLLPLVEALTEYDSEDIVKVVRFQVDEKELSLRDDWLSLKHKKNAP